MSATGEFFGATKSFSSMIGSIFVWSFRACSLYFFPVLKGLNKFFSLPEESSSEHSSKLVPLSDEGLSSI